MLEASAFLERRRCSRRRRRRKAERKDGRPQTQIQTEPCVRVCGCVWRGLVYGLPGTVFLSLSLRFHPPLLVCLVLCSARHQLSFTYTKQDKTAMRSSFTHVHRGRLRDRHTRTSAWEPQSGCDAEKVRHKDTRDTCHGGCMQTYREVDSCVVTEAEVSAARRRERVKKVTARCVVLLLVSSSCS